MIPTIIPPSDKELLNFLMRKTGSANHSQLAKAIDYPKSDISRINTGKATIRFGLLSQASRATGIPVSELLLIKGNTMTPQESAQAKIDKDAQLQSDLESKVDTLCDQFKNLVMGNLITIQGSGILQDHDLNGQNLDSPKQFLMACMQDFEQQLRGKQPTKKAIHNIHQYRKFL